MTETSFAHEHGGSEGGNAGYTVTSTPGDLSASVSFSDQDANEKELEKNLADSIKGQRQANADLRDAQAYIEFLLILENAGAGASCIISPFAGAPFSMVWQFSRKGTSYLTGHATGKTSASRDFNKSTATGEIINFFIKLWEKSKQQAEIELEIEKTGHFEI